MRKEKPRYFYKKHNNSMEITSIDKKITPVIIICTISTKRHRKENQLEKTKLIAFPQKARAFAVANGREVRLIEKPLYRNGKWVRKSFMENA